MLIMDNHCSHISERFKLACFDAKIIPLYLPPHSSHVTQPLDIAGFGALKQAYRAAIQDSIFIENTALQLKREFIKNYDRARKKALRAANVKSGFASAGLVPFIPQRLYQNKLLVVPEEQSTSEQPEPSRMTPPPDLYGLAVVATPRKREDWRPAIESLQESSLGTAEGRAKGRKLLKQLELQHARITSLEFDLEVKTEQLAAAQLPKTKKQVKLVDNAVSITGQQAVEQVEGVVSGKATKPVKKAPARASKKAVGG